MATAEAQALPQPDSGASVVAVRESPFSARAELAIHIGFIAAIGLIWANALILAWTAADPWLRSDNWDFVHLIVQPFYRGDLNWSELLLKRDAFDHSQPLRRLILLANSVWFGMDFRLEALFATGVSLINIGLLWVIAREAWSRGTRSMRLLARLVFLVIAAVYVSINAQIVFTWSLLTLNYTSHTFILLALLAGWRAYRRGGRWAYLVLFVLALMADAVADDTATVATVAFAMALMLAGLRQDARRRAVLVSATAIAALVVYLVLYRILAPPIINTGSPGVGALIADLAAHWRDFWQWVEIPLAASIVQQVHFEIWFKSATDQAVAVALIAIVVLIGHVWFWVRALRGRINLASFVAVAVMLMFYGLMAGILVVRVSQADSATYLWSPRYALIYQWNLVALLLMLLAQLPRDQAEVSEAETLPQRRRWSLALPVAGAIALLLVQVPLTKDDWTYIKSLKNVADGHAQQMEQLARDPINVPDTCASLLKACTYPPGQRVQDMQFLVDNQLNLFSPQVDQRWGVDPNSLGSN